LATIKRNLNGQEAVPNADKGAFLKRIRIGGRDTLTFGEENIPLAMEIAPIVNGKDGTPSQVREAIDSLTAALKTKHTKEVGAKLDDISRKEKEAGGVQEELEALKLIIKQHEINLRIINDVELYRKQLQRAIGFTSDMRNQKFITHYGFGEDPSTPPPSTVTSTSSIISLD